MSEFPAGDPTREGSLGAPLELRVRTALGSERFEELLAQARSQQGLPRRLIFTVTTGRSGTAALAHRMGSLRGVTATHEPRPSFAEALRSVNRAPGLALEFWVRRKLPAIARGRSAIYVETSHLAGLGFLEELTLLGLPLELILLARPARAVALSLWRLDTIPGRNLRGHRYYLSPRDPVQLRLPLDRLDGLHDYQLCYWYAREVEARQALWERRATSNGPRIVRLETRELERPNVTQRLAEELDLGIRRWTIKPLEAALGTRHRNDKRDKKLPRDLTPSELERLEDEVRLLVRDSPDGLHSKQ